MCGKLDNVLQYPYTWSLVSHHSVSAPSAVSPRSIAGSNPPQKARRNNGKSGTTSNAKRSTSGHSLEKPHHCDRKPSS